MENAFGTVNQHADNQVMHRLPNPSLPFNEHTTEVRSPGVDTQVVQEGNMSLDDYTQQDEDEATTDPQGALVDDEPFNKYSLRYMSDDLKRTFPSTWVDHDASGDYDPDEKARSPRPRKKRPKPLHREQLDWYDQTPNRTDSAIGFKPVFLPRPSVRLIFTDPTAKARLGEICTSAQAKPPPARDDFTEGYRLRKQKLNVQEQLAELSDEQSDATALPDNLTGHPCARGCKGCLRMSIECSLLLDEHFWPCENCRGDKDEACELIVPPARKLACLRCQRLRHRNGWLRCSYLYDGEHEDQCEHCARNGQPDCVAGPDPSSIKVRIRLGFDGQPYTHEAHRVQKTVRDNSCRQCQVAKRMCSFSNGGTGDTCTACDMTAATCEPLIAVCPKTQPGSARQKRISDYMPAMEQSPAKEQSPEKKQSPEQVQSPAKEQASNAADLLSGEKDVDDFLDISDASDPEQEVESGSPSYIMSGALPVTPPHARPEAANADTSSRGRVRRVQTKFCHPMRFNWELDSTSELKCHFCSSAHFPILGLEEREVEVIDWDSGEGLEEISGGHAGDGVESTRVCLECTTTRLEIILCERHQLRSILGLNAASLDLEAALARLMDGDEDIGRVKWCAVCCNLATHECVTGCGLQLCKHCATAVTYEHRWDLQEILVRIGEQASDERPLGLRADYELLKSNGLLVRYVQFATG